ncbi:DUF881 domain-containing protein [Alkalihalobacillus sp. 1P02AB]|uniref:DUF881 domain-containing protein n=1 Tax=Alkalihalobacillus sp. 1P02AB TaxID=3132260 RepID=UPI0039A5AA8B
MKQVWIFTIVACIIGFMITVQYQSLQVEEPTVRDTRDVRELRELLRQSQENRIQLMEEIDKLKLLVMEYETTLNNREDVVTVLENQIEELKATASLSEITGDGVVIRIESLIQDEFLGKEKRTPPPELFRFLLNEVKSFGAKEIAVGTERIITTSAFREVNGITQLNYKRIPPLPLEVKVISDNPERLHNELLVSSSIEEFEVFGYLISITLEENLSLPAFEQTPRVRYMEEVKGE